MRPPVRAMALLAATAALGACAPHPIGSAAAAPAPVRAAAPGTGTIVAVRPIARRTAGGILAALGATAAPPVAGQAFEFIVREDAGTTVSLVQVNDAGFSPGERVRLVGGERTRLARVPPPSGA